MTSDAQRVAIAEACGAKWQLIQWFGKATSVLSFKFEARTDPDLGPMRRHLQDGRFLAANILNYPADLNAMHKAEKMLNEDQKFDYNDILDGLEPNRWVWERTAAQRAEAFLRTLNLWE